MLAKFFALLLLVAVDVALALDLNFLDQFQKLLLGNVDKQADPCQPYNHTCRKASPGPMSDQHGKDVERITTVIIEDAVQSIDMKDEKTPRYKKSLRTYFEQSKSFAELSVDNSFKMYVINVQKYLPPLQATMKSSDDKFFDGSMWKTVGFLRHVFYDSGLIDFNVETNKNNGKMRYLRIRSTQPDYDFRDWDVPEEAYAETINQVADIYKLHVDNDTVANMSSQIVTFNNELRNIHFRNHTDEDSDLLEFDDLSKQFPNVSWVSLLENIFSASQLKAMNESRVKYRVHDVSTFELIANFFNGQKPLVAYNYVLYRNYMDFLVAHDLEEFKGGAPWRHYCRGFGPALVKTVFDHNGWNYTNMKRETEEHTVKIMSSMKSYFYSSFSNNKEEMFQILNDTEITHSFHDWLMDDEAIDKRTPEYLPNNDFMTNVFNQAKRSEDDIVVQLVNGTEPWLDTEPYFYDSFKKNHVDMYEMLPPFYNESYPASMKMGTNGLKLIMKILRGSPLLTSGLAGGFAFSNNQAASTIGSSMSIISCLMNSVLSQGMNIANMAFQNQSPLDLMQSLIPPELKQFTEDQRFMLGASYQVCSGEFESEDHFDKLFKNFLPFNKAFGCKAGAAGGNGQNQPGQLLDNLMGNSCGLMLNRTFVFI